MRISQAVRVEADLLHLVKNMWVVRLFAKKGGEVLQPPCAFACELRKQPENVLCNVRPILSPTFARGLRVRRAGDPAKNRIFARLLYGKHRKGAGGREPSIFKQ